MKEYLINELKDGDYKIVNIDGNGFAFDKELKYISLVQSQMEYVGQIVKFKKYDITGNEPVFVNEYDYTVDALDLEIIKRGNETI